MFHLKFNFFHIGDQIATTAIPENIFNVTGEKCIISDERIWAFKHNPHVVFKSEEEANKYPTISLIPDCRVQEQAKQYVDVMKLPVTNGQTEYMCIQLGFNNVHLRHSRLYIYEDEPIVPNRIVIHTTGSDRRRDGEIAIRTTSGEDDVRVMSDDVLDSINKNYAHYEKIQVGGDNDKPLGGDCTNLCGKLDYWEVARLIAGSAKFIGVNSGPMHIANCYPRVEKRIVLQEFSIDTLMTYRPGDVRNWLFSWIDPTCTFFNKFDHDVGYTYSHKKL